MRTSRKHSKFKAFLVIFVSLIMIVSFMPFNAFASDNDVLKIDSLDGHFRFNPGETAQLRVYVPLDKYTCKWEILTGQDVAALKTDPSDTSLATLQFKELKDLEQLPEFQADDAGVTVNVTVKDAKGNKVGETFDYYQCTLHAYGFFPPTIESLAVGEFVKKDFLTVEKEYDKEGQPIEHNGGFTWFFDDKVVEITDSEGTAVKDGEEAAGSLFTIRRLSPEYTRIVVFTDIGQEFPLFHAYFLDPASDKADLRVSKEPVTIKYSKLKKKTQTVSASKVFTLNMLSKDVTFKKTSGNSKIKVSSSGKITVKKGLKKKTYSIKVKVSTKGNKFFNAGSKTVTVKVRVK